MKTTKIYFPVKVKGEIILKEFPRGLAGKKLWDQLIHEKTKTNKRIKPSIWN